MATGSIGDLNAPVLFIGESAIAGGYKPVSKIYQGANVPTLGASYGSTMDGTPFYSNNDKTLYILDRNGNIAMDFTGNIEGNTISGVTINALTASFVSGSNTVSAPTGSFGQINVSNIAFTGLTEGRVTLVGPSGSLVDSGSLNYDGSQLGITGSIKLNDTAYIYNDGQLYIEDTTNGLYLNAGNSYLNFNNGGYTNLRSDQNGIDIEASGGGQLWLWADSADVWIGSYDNSTLHLNNDSGEGNVNVLNGDGNVLNVYGDMVQTGSIYTTKILGTGSLYLQPDQNDGRLFEIYNTTGVTGNDIHIKGNADYNYFGGDINYLKLDDASGYVTLIGDNGVTISSNVGNVAISSYDGSTLFLNTDGGEGDINIGNYGNSIYGYTNTTDFLATNYAQLRSSGSYLWVESIGSHVHNDNNGVAGFTARPNSIIEATGSLHIYGDTQISGNTSVTGSLVVSAGAAFIDQGVVSQNSNVLLTSGSNLIIQDGGNANIAGDVYITGSEAVDYIYGYTQQWNYLALNGSVSGTPNVELGSTSNISLWAEGGTINVTGSIKVTNDLIVEQNMFVSGNIYQTGSFYTQGDIVLSGSINIGDNIGVDTINFQGEVSSSILPKVNNAFDLGGPSNYWHDLYVSGTAHIGVLEASSISLSGITVFNDLQVSGSIYNFTLTPTDVVFVDADQRLTGSAAFTYAYDGDYGDNVLTAPIIRASNDGNGTNFLIGNDMWLGDVNEGNATRFMGNENNEIAKIYLGSNSTDNYLYANYGDVSLSANNSLYLQSQNNNVNISSYDGNILYLNNDGGEGDVYVLNGGGNQLHIYGDVYQTSGHTINTDRLVGVTNASNIIDLNDIVLGNLGLFSNNDVNVSGSNIYISGSSSSKIGQLDNTGFFYTSENYAEMYGQGGLDVYSDGGNLWVYNNNGDVDISSYGGTLQLNTDGDEGDVYVLNGSNNLHVNGPSAFTGSVSIDGDTNIINNHTLTVDGEGNFHTNVYITGNTYSDNFVGLSYNTNSLHLNGGTFGAPDVELTSLGNISLFSEGGRGAAAAINMTGSVHITNDLDVSGSIYAGVISNYNGDINGGGIYIDSVSYSEISYNNEENYLYVANDGLYAETNIGTNQFISNAGDTTITANNGYHVNINGGGINLNGATSVTGAFTVSSGSMTSLGGDLYVSGNLQVLGSQTNVNLESHTVNIGDNIILVNAYSPFQRYAGLAAFDSGSSGVSGSLLWDSLNDYWMFVSSSNQTSKLVGTTAGTYGSEASLTSGTFPIADGANNIGDSLLTYTGTTLALNINKFTVDSETGNTHISGNVTVDMGGDDNGEGSSWVTFRNSDNVLGFVDSTDTFAETTQLLGYDAGDGTLKFSSVIDGGQY
jgi:hypothetical protein